MQVFTNVTTFFDSRRKTKPGVKSNGTRGIGEYWQSWGGEKRERGPDLLLHRCARTTPAKYPMVEICVRYCSFYWL